MTNPIHTNRLALLLAGAALLCALAGVATVALRQPQFTTRQAAISHTLRQHGVAFKHVGINRVWPDTVNTITFGAHLVILLPTDRTVSGRVECRDGERSCYISVPSLGISRAPIPDVEPSRPWPLLVWIDRQIAWLRAQL